VQLVSDPQQEVVRAGELGDLERVQVALVGELAHL
jgi:hypothetical protein